MPALRTRKRSSKIALSTGIALLVAIGIAGLVHVLVPPPGAAPRNTVTEPTYSINPASVLLTTADIGANFSLPNGGPIPPSQRTAENHPLPYQKYFLGGWVRNFMIQSALVPPGRTEIDQYSESLGIQPSDPPTIFGPFVAEHHGLFEVSSAAVSYQLASAAHPDYLVSHPGPDVNANYMFNYDNWRTYPIQLGDEADAWGGIQHMTVDPPHTDPPQAYEEQVFRIRWRQGPIVSTLFISGAHDLTLATGLRLALIMDARIASAVQQHTTPPATKGAFDASHFPSLAASVPGLLAICDVDRRARQRLNWA